MCDIVDGSIVFSIYLCLVIKPRVTCSVLALHCQPDRPQFCLAKCSPPWRPFFYQRVPHVTSFLASHIFDTEFRSFNQLVCNSRNTRFLSLCLHLTLTFVLKTFATCPVFLSWTASVGSVRTLGEVLHTQRLQSPLHSRNASTHVQDHPPSRH